jgi:hypothetical protein
MPREAVIVVVYDAADAGAAKRRIMDPTIVQSPLLETGCDLTASFFRFVPDIAPKSCQESCEREKPRL